MSEELKTAVDDARIALQVHLPTEDEYELAALRILKDGVITDDVIAQDKMFGDAAAGLRASLAAKEFASIEARLTLKIAERNLRIALAAEAAAAEPALEPTA